MARALLVCLVCFILAPAAPVPAQDESSGAVTTADEEIPLDELELLLRPLTQADLEVEADAWMDVLKSKARQISMIEIAIKQKNREIEAAGESAELETEAKTSMFEDLTELQTEQTALIDRVNTVLTELEEKGGDSAKYRTYVAAVSGLRLDVSDTSAAWATVTGWLKSPEGGVRWSKNIGAFVALVFAFWVLSLIVGKIVERATRMGRRLSSLMRDFIATSVRRIVLIVGVVVALSALEVNVGPLLAVIGAAGFVIAFALQDSLGNLASGIMILVYRPFDVGDAVDVAGVSGKVNSMNLVSTTIKTFDNKVVVVPNNKIWGDVITNVTGSTQRRVDMVFGIGYGSDMARAQEILERIVSEHELTLEEPAPVIKVHELADSSVNFICRPWARTEDYWTVFWDVTRRVKEEFDKAGVSIPFPQRDVHVYHADREPPVTEVTAGARSQLTS